MEWLKSIFSEWNGVGSTRRVLLALAVLATLGLCGVHIWKHGLDQTIKDLLIWLNGTLAVLAGAGKREERLQAAQGVPAAPAGPPAAP